MPRIIDLVVKDEDIAYANRQDKWACALVRSIQRTIPEATRVTVDAKHIRFSLESAQTRYEFETPPEAITNIVKPFDLGEDLTKIPLSKRTFVIDHATASWPMVHHSLRERTEARARHGAARRRAPKLRDTQNPNVRNANRFREDGTLNEV